MSAPAHTYLLARLIEDQPEPDAATATEALAEATGGAS